MGSGSGCSFRTFRGSLPHGTCSLPPFRDSHFRQIGSAPSAFCYTDRVPTHPTPPPATSAITRATTALVVAADAIAATLATTPDDGAQPSARAWLTTALHAVAIAHDAAEAAGRELDTERE